MFKLFWNWRWLRFFVFVNRLLVVAELARARADGTRISRQPSITNAESQSSWMGNLFDDLDDDSNGTTEVTQPQPPQVIDFVDLFD